MEYQLWIQNKGNLYDATPVTLDGIRWEMGEGKAGKLTFSLWRDGVVQFVEGDKVQFLIDGTVVFSGWVVSKERNSEQIISVTAYDQMFFMVRNKETLVYWDKTATEVIRLIAGKHGLTVGEVDDTKWVIPQRIEEGQSLLDMVYSALDITEQATGARYFFFDKGGKLQLKGRDSMRVPVILGNDGGISDYHYKTDISKDTYNIVKLYQAGRKETERLAWQAENSEKVKEWGRLQYYQHVPYTLAKGQLQGIAQQILREKCRVSKALTIENSNGGTLLYPGNSILLEIPDLAEISLRGEALIKGCIHTFCDGEWHMELDIEVKE